jgi:hypothetical protein
MSLFLFISGCSSPTTNNFYTQVNGEIVASENLPKSFKDYKLSETYATFLIEDSLKVSIQYIDEEQDKAFMLEYQKLNGEVLEYFIREELNAAIFPYKSIEFQGEVILQGYFGTGWFISENEFIRLSLDEELLEDGIILNQLFILFPVDEKTNNYGG